MSWRALGGSLAVLLGLPCASQAQQGFEGRVGRFYQDEGWTVYRLGLSRPLAGPIGTTFHGDYFRRVRDEGGALGGVGLDLTAFHGGGGPYLVAGLGAGLGSGHSMSFSSTWTSWSAGVGYELVPASFLAVGAEGRWREISLDRRQGFEFAAGLSINLGGGRKSPTPAAPRSPTPGSTTPRANDDDGPTVTTSLPATPRVGHAAQLADSVVATATDVMGRPYRYGGTGQNGSGFDCSGLIQYAYGQHGVSLPRTSAEQAREGRAVGKNPTKLLPGDLLTFSNRGGPVTHVGLYVGGGRFIHSATRGVQISALSADDPYGRWWWKRWVGVRRIVE